MADVQGLMADPRFQGLDPATQRETLGKLDPRFSKLTDEQFTEFKTKASPAKAAPSLGQRLKDWQANVPNIMDITRGKQVQGGYSPAEEFVLGGMMPGEAAPNVTRAVGQQLRGGRIGKFFTGIGEKAEQIAEERKAASDPDFARLKKSAEDFKPGQRPTPKSGGPNPAQQFSSPASPKGPKTAPEATPEPWKPLRGKPSTQRSHGPNPGSDHGPATTPKGPPSKAEAVRAAPAEPTVPPTKGRAPRASDEFYETQGRADKVFRVADDMFRKKISAQALEAKGKPPDMSESTWKHLLFRLRGLETGRVKPITAQ